MATSDSTPLKRCNKCGVKKPLNDFSKDKSKKSGLRNQCKSCRANADKLYYQENKEAVDRKTQKWRDDNRDHVNTYHRDYHHNVYRPYHQQYYSDHKDHILSKNRAWAKDNPEKNREISKITQHRRRARKLNLPVQWSDSDAKRMHSYWGNKCCICGRQVDFWTLIAEDHWIAISDPRPDNPGTVPWNMLPMCHARKGSNGMSSCNQSKLNKAPIEWLFSRLENKSATKKLAEIETYFEWIINQNDI